MTENVFSEINIPRTKNSLIAVMGVGGAGGNAVGHMWHMGIEGVTFMVCNTDEQALAVNPVEQKIQMGPGLGAGGNAEEGRRLALESIDEIRQALTEMGARMLFIAAGMGGGTGTGASPVIARLAKEMGLLTVAVVTSPFPVEGRIRFDQAQEGINELRKTVDSLLVINNENIAKLYRHASLKEAFSKADDILLLATKGIAEIITVKSDLVNVDFADVKRVMSNSGRAHMAVATAEGEGRALQVAEASLNSPLLESSKISGAQKILVNVSVDQADHLSLQEVMDILDFIQASASVRTEDGKTQMAEIIWGTSEKPSLGDAIELVMVATGFPQSVSERLSAERAYEPVKPKADNDEEDGGSVFKSFKQSKTEAEKPKVEPPIVLGAPSSRYENIDRCKEEPAFVKRHATFITQSGSSRKAVVRDTELDAATPAESHSEDLFD